MDPSIEEARSGASPLRTVIDVTLPLMALSILAGGLLGIYCRRRWYTCHCRYAR